MTSTDEELEHLYIKAIFSIENDKEDGFLLKGKLLSKSGLKEKTVLDDHDEEQPLDGNMLILSRIGKAQRFDGKDKRASTSSNSDLESRLCKVEDELKKLVSVQEVTTSDDTKIREGKKEMDKKKSERNFENTTVEYTKQVTSLGDDEVDKEIGKECENDRVSIDEKQGKD
ncbi:hypothetical protein PanWU01x14_105670 [Parasponia andersonii]|uniref:Uncharacterized protein n=1 Tax=Parasponia andersonii TaxID=3476 RepID=A0A2P5D181_PARAD|nr:hypothetical protein PanWU01x14_105670 [Parasponia andersonii]